MAFPAFLGKSLQNPKRYKTFTVTYTTFTSPSAPKAGGAQPPLFSTFTKLGGFSPPSPPGSAAYVMIMMMMMMMMMKMKKDGGVSNKRCKAQSKLYYLCSLS